MLCISDSQPVVFRNAVLIKDIPSQRCCESLISPARTLKRCGRRKPASCKAIHGFPNTFVHGAVSQHTAGWYSAPVITDCQNNKILLHSQVNRIKPLSPVSSNHPSPSPSNLLPIQHRPVLSNMVATGHIWLLKF